MFEHRKLFEISILIYWINEDDTEEYLSKFDSSSLCLIPKTWIKEDPLDSLSETLLLIRVAKK